jgi:hypothetical protein
MHKSIIFFRTIVLLCFVFLPVLTFSQTLVEISDQTYQTIDESKILWSETKGNSVFLLISDSKMTDFLNSSFKILDEVTEPNRYYWLYAVGVTSIDWSKEISTVNVQLLWSNENTALVKSLIAEMPPDLPSVIKKRRIIFEKYPEAPMRELNEFSGWNPKDILTAQTIIDSVSIDSIYYTERHLTGMESFNLSTGIDSLQSRHSYNPQIFKAQQYLKERLENYGYTVNLHPFSLSGNTLYNIEAVKMGAEYPNQCYIICAHYDDAPSGPIAPGADDNGSGTATVIEAARVLRDYDFRYTIRFVLFPGEEQGLWGSYYYAQAAAAAGDSIWGVINIDMIGYDGNDDGIMEIHAGNLASSQQIGTLMVNNVTSWGLGLTAQYKTSTSSGASDHASFWNVGYPAIMHIEDFQDFNIYYHTTNDRLSALAMSYFQENAKLSIGTLAVLSQIDSAMTGIVGKQVPEDFILEDPYPNPFNPTVSIKYNLPLAGQVQVKVFDILGRPVKELVDSRQNSGWHDITWNATNEWGNNVSSGIYFIQVQTGYSVQMKKAVLLR